jgi:hypothetical protein
MRTSRVSVILILMFCAAALSTFRSQAGYGPGLHKKGTSFKVVGYLAGQNFRRIDARRTGLAGRRIKSRKRIN